MPNNRLRILIPLVIFAVIIVILLGLSFRKTLNVREFLPTGGKRDFSTLWNNRDFKKILTHTERILSRNPSDETALLFDAMSSFYLSSEQITRKEREYYLERSIRTFRKLMALTDDPAIKQLAHYHLGKAYVWKGPEYADIAIILLKESQESNNPRYSDIELFMAEAYFQMSEYDLSLEYFRKSSTKSDSPELQFRLAEVAALTGEYSTAVEAYKTGIKSTNNQLERETALYKLGKLYYDMKRYSLARETLEQYVSFIKTDPEAYFFLGEIAHQMGETQRARQYWVQCTRIVPGYRPALLKLYN